MSITLNGSTGLSGPDGTAGTPALQGSDSNTGIYYQAADVVGVAVNGADAARFNSSGLLVDKISELTPNSGTQIQGIKNGSSVSSGYIGQILSGFVNPNSQPALNAWTLMSTNAFSIPAGIWMVWIRGAINITTGITSGSFGMSITSTSAPDMDTVGTMYYGSAAAENLYRMSGVCPPKIFNVTTTTTVRVFAARGNSSFGDFFFYDYWALRVG